MDHERLLAQLLEWAQGNENIRAALLTGSVARTDGLRDQLSDLDIELYVREPAALLDHDDWYRRRGGARGDSTDPRLSQLVTASARV